MYIAVTAKGWKIHIKSSNEDMRAGRPVRSTPPEIAGEQSPADQKTYSDAQES